MRRPIRAMGIMSIWLRTGKFTIRMTVGGRRRRQTAAPRFRILHVIRYMSFKRYKCIIKNKAWIETWPYFYYAIPACSLLLKKEIRSDILKWRDVSCIQYKDRAGVLNPKKPYKMRRPRLYNNRGNYEKSMCNFTIYHLCKQLVLMKIV